MASNVVQAEVIKGFDAVPSLGVEWERIFRESRREPSTSLEWTLGLIHHRVEPADRTFVIRLHRRGVTVGFVPVMARTVRVFRLPCVLLQPLLEIFNTHSDLLLAERSPAVVDAFLGALNHLGIRWDCLRMSKLLEDNPLTASLEQSARACGWTSSTRLWRASYHLPLPVTFEAYLSARSAKFRNHAKRAEKKLRAAGEIAVREITTPGEFESAYDALLHIERSSWKEARGISIHAVSRQTAFYREWGHAAAAAGRLHLQLLTLNGEPIAHNVGYVSGGWYYYLKTSYAAEHRPLSPATFLRLRLIEGLIARGITTVDFPGTPFEWEQQWTDVVRWQNVVSVYPKTIRGRLFAALDRWAHHSSAERTLKHGAKRPDEAESEGK